MHSRFQLFLERLLAYSIVISPPIAGAATAVLLIRHRNRLGEVRRARWTLGVFALAGALGLTSAFLAESWQAGIQGPAGLLVLFIAWLVGWSAVDNPERFWRDLQRGVGLIALLTSAWILKPFNLQLVWGGFTVPIASPRDPVAVFGLGANGLGPLLVFGAILALGRLYRQGRAGDRIEACAIAVSALAAALAIGVRSAVPGALAGALTLMLSSGPAGSLLVMLVTLAVAIPITLHTGMWGAPIDLSTEAPRIKLWSSALRMGADHPWLGVGPFHFVRANSRYMMGDPNLALGLGPHNIYLRMLAEWGIPATLVLFAWLFSWPIRLWERREEIWRWSFVAALAAFLVMGMFDDPLFTMHVSAPVFAGIGLAAADVPRSQTA